MNRILTKTVNYAAAAGFIIIFLCCFFPLVKSAGVFLLLVPVFLALGVLGFRLAAKLSSKTCVIVFFILLPVWGYLVYLLGLALEQLPAWDFGRVFTGMRELVLNDAFVTEATKDYFLTIPNNFFITIYLYRGVMLFGSLGVYPLDAVLIINSVSLSASVLFIFLAFLKSGRPQQGFFTAVCCFFFAPMLLYASVYYTDTLSMPFVCAAVYTSLAAHNADRARAKLIFGLLTGLGAGVGYLFKATPVIVLAAIILFMFLYHGRRAVLFSAVSAAAFSLVLVFWQLYMYSNPYLVFSKEPYHAELPASHYVMMGLRGNGGYSGEDHEFSSSIETFEQRKIQTRRVIGERVREYGFFGLLGHLRQKIVYTWADGGYYAPQKIAIEPVSDSVLPEYLAYGGERYAVTEKVLAACQMTLLILVSFGAARCAIVGDGRPDMLFAARTAVFGLALFLLVWETRSRYLVNFAPLLAALAVNEYGTVNFTWRVKNTKSREAYPGKDAKSGVRFSRNK